MNILIWIISLSLTGTIFMGALSYHRAAVCRQEAWLKGTELATRSLLSQPKPRESIPLLRCQAFMERRAQAITWRGSSEVRTHAFVLPLRGRL